MRIRFANIVAAFFALCLSLPATAANYADWWWGGPAQSGQGVNVGQQANLVFASWFSYDEQGNGMWLVFSGPLDGAGKVVQGTLYRTTGPALGTTFDATKVAAAAVGSGTLMFDDMHHATFVWSVDGMNGRMTLVRQSYGASRIAGDFDGFTDGTLHCDNMGMAMGMGMPMEPTDMTLHAQGSLSISVAGGQATGTAAFGSQTCAWTGDAVQSGQMVHVTGTAMCPPPVGAAALDLSLLVVDRALVAWQRLTSSSMMGSCAQMEQYSMVRRD
jgi:hypothetical protein